MKSYLIIFVLFIAAALGLATVYSTVKREQAEAPAQLCLTYYDLAHTIAVARDNQIPREVVEAAMLSGGVEHDLDVDVLRYTLEVAKVIYDSPEVPAEVLASALYNECLEAFQQLE